MATTYCSVNYDFLFFCKNDQVRVQLAHQGLLVKCVFFFLQKENINDITLENNKTQQDPYNYKVIILISKYNYHIERKKFYILRLN